MEYDTGAYYTVHVALNLCLSRFLLLGICLQLLALLLSFNAVHFIPYLLHVISKESAWTYSFQVLEVWRILANIYTEAPAWALIIGFRFNVSFLSKIFSLDLLKTHLVCHFNISNDKKVLAFGVSPSPDHSYSGGAVLWSL